MTIRPVAAAATAIVLTTACNGAATPETSEAASTLATTSTVLVEETTTTTTQPTTTEAEVSGWEAIRVWRGGQGEFRTGVFEPAFSFSVEGAGWTQAGGDTERMIDMLKGSLSVAVILLDRGDVGETTSFLSGLEGIEVTADPQATSIDGAEGVQFDLSAGANTKVVTFANESGYQMISGHDYRVFVVDIQGTVVSILVEIPPGTPRRTVSDALAIVDSITWRSTN